MNPRLAAAVGAVLLAGASGAFGYYVAANRLKVVDYCAVAQCGSLADAIAEGLDPVKLILCCNYVTGDCVLVDSLSECHPEFEYAVVCTHGASTPVEGGTECYD